MDNKKSQQRYFGTVSEIKDGGAYGFIASVGDPYGSIVATNGDVYISANDGDGPLQVDQRFEFELETDPRRVGRFKAINTKLTNNVPVLASTSQELAVLSVRTSYHDHAKFVPPAEVTKALACRPFSQALEATLEPTAYLQTEEDIDRFIIAFLRETFVGLDTVGVVYDMRTAGNAEERREVENSIEGLKEMGMAAQASKLTMSYEIFVATCEILRECRKRGMPAPGMRMTFSMLHLMVGGADIQTGTRGDLGRLGDVEKRVALAVETIHFLRDSQLLRPGCVVPIDHVADILMAAPVWYIASKQQEGDRWNEEDPLPDHAVKYFGSLIGNQNWANLYQMWNRRTRSLARYEGDQIPPYILNALRQARQHFDYVVVATPYHDVAGREWEDPAWQRQIDPFLFGFKKGLPYIYFLGRWSDSGIFPLMPEMIADTIAYLRANKERLAGFGGNPFWYFINEDHPDKTSHARGACLGRAGAKLISLADQLIAAFDNGTLFDFIRGTAQPSAGLARS